MSSEQAREIELLRSWCKCMQSRAHVPLFTYVMYEIRRLPYGGAEAPTILRQSGLTARDGEGSDWWVLDPFRHPRVGTQAMVGKGMNPISFLLD